MLQTSYIQHKEEKCHAGHSGDALTITLRSKYWVINTTCNLRIIKATTADTSTEHTDFNHLKSLLTRTFITQKPFRSSIWLISLRPLADLESETLIRTEMKKKWGALIGTSAVVCLLENINLTSKSKKHKSGLTQLNYNIKKNLCDFFFSDIIPQVGGLVVFIWRCLHTGHCQFDLEWVMGMFNQVPNWCWWMLNKARKINKSGVDVLNWLTTPEA